MSRREAWLSAGAVFALALVVRAVAAATLSFPVPEDTAYYAGVARNLVEGRGLVSDALWSYGTPPLAVAGQMMVTRLMHLRRKPSQAISKPAQSHILGID